MARSLYTEWGKKLDPAYVLQEYPRPQLRRAEWVNLNGFWEYAFTRTDVFPEKMDGLILVPFSPEAPLSGVNRQLQPDEVLQYSRTFELPFVSTGTRWILHFGAVDQSCLVYVNGRKAGSHTGGYLPFSLDVTALLQEGENTLQMMVRDLSDTSCHAKGKQSLERGGMWYTAQSGIWQTVWLEPVPEQYITRVRLTPDYDKGEIRVKVLTNEPESSFPVQAVVSLRGKQVGTWEVTTGRTYGLPLGEFESWSPESPVLYDIRLRMGQDSVQSYFGMRKVSMERDDKGILRFFLNNRPYFHNGVLDQGYFSDGLMTPPSDRAMLEDIRTVKSLGFNMLRKHIKIEPDRWYYHCDREGVLVWQDMVCGGEKYPYWFVTALPTVVTAVQRAVKDNHYGLFSRKDSAGRREYIRELKETVRLLYDHPCIVAWVPFNEGWGQFDASAAVTLLRKLDPGRLIDEASGWYDQGGGDMYSIHNYFRKLKVRPKKDRAVALTEFGGYSLPDAEHSLCEKEYGYKKFETQNALMDALAGLWEEQLIPNISRGLTACVYTQVSDIEDEVNGLLTYDRDHVKVDAERMRECNRRLMEEFARCTEA